jgi:hypothetical protein
VLEGQRFLEDAAHLRRVRLINHATNARNKTSVMSLVMAMRFVPNGKARVLRHCTVTPPRWFFTDHARIKTDGSMPDKVDVERVLAFEEPRFHRCARIDRE